MVTELMIAASLAMTAGLLADTAGQLWTRARTRRMAGERLAQLARGESGSPRWMHSIAFTAPFAESDLGWRNGIVRAVEATLSTLLYRGESFDSLVRRAGLAPVVGFGAVVAASVRLMLVGSGAGLVVGLILGMPLVGILAGAWAGGLFPSHFLKREARRRSERISVELPAMVDLVALGLEAGLSLDRALALYWERRSGPLASELEEADRIARLGLTRRDKALAEVSAMSGSASFVRFTSVVSQAINLGTPLVAVLDAQAADARAAHRTLIEERIARAPIRMIIPLGLLILPAMILIVIGPMAASFIGG